MKVKLVNDLGEVLLTEELKPVTFKTGSRGMRSTFKVCENGSRFQGSVQLVEIGSKPKAAPKA